MKPPFPVERCCSFFSFFRRLRCDLRRLPKAPSSCPAKWHRITPQRIWNIGLALDPLNSSSYQVISAAKAPCCWCAVQKTHEHVGLLQFLTSKNAVVQSQTPTFPSFQLASANATIACHFGWAPLQDFPIFTTQLCKTSPQITSKRHDMIMIRTTKDTPTTLSMLWTPRAGNLQHIKFQDFGQDRGASNEKGEKHNIIFFRKKKTQLWNPTGTQRTCGIHQWLAPVPWRKLWAHPIRHDQTMPSIFQTHLIQTFKTPEPKTQFGKSPSKNGNLPNGFREVKGRESLTHFETPMASSEICYCYSRYMEWWHIPTESSTGCAKLQEINWHKHKLQTSSAIAPISKIYSVVACALINRKTDKQTMTLGVHGFDWFIGLSAHQT